MVIEQIPLPLIFHDAVMISPAMILVFCHNDSLEIPGTQGRLRHGVGQCLSGVLAFTRLTTHPRERQIVPVATAEGKRTFLEAIGQTFHFLTTNFHGRHFRLSLALGELHLLQFTVQFQHIILQLGTTYAHTTPVEVGSTIVIDKYAGVNAHHSFDGLLFASVRSFWFRGSCHTNGKTTAFAWSVRVEKVVLAVLADTVRSPHGVPLRIAPGHTFLTDDDAMVGPLGKVLRRTHMIVGHAEPVLSLTFGGHDVMRREQIDPVVKNTCRRVGRKLPADDGILRSHRQWQAEQGHK